MLRFGPEMKRIHPIMFFGHNSYVLVCFGPFRYCAGNHAGVAFNATIRAENETMHQFGPKMKRTHPIMFFGPNSDVLVHFGRFCYCDRNHDGVAFNAPIRVRNETMLRFGPEMKRIHPIMFFGYNSDVLVHFGPFRYRAGNLAGVAFNATIRAENEMMHRFGPKMKRTQPIMFFGPNSDVLVHFGLFRYCDGNHAGVAFNATIRVENEMMHRLGPQMKRTQPIMFFGPN